VAYADSTGKWRLAFNIVGAVGSSTAEQIISVTGVTFLSTEDQGIAAGELGGTPSWGICVKNTSNIRSIAAAAGTNGRYLSGDVALNAEPTWAAANMEGALPVDVWIAPVVPGTSAGIVPATGLPGNTTGNAIAAGYVGQALGTEDTGTNGSSFYTASTTALGGGTSAVTVVTYTVATKGIYWIEFSHACRCGATEQRTHSTVVLVGGSAVSPAIEMVRDEKSSPMFSLGLPIRITADNTSVAIAVTIASGANADTVNNNAFITGYRIA